LMGLWSIYGVICAPLYLLRNVRGGEQITVEQAYLNLSNPAEAARRENAFNPVFPYVIGGLALLAVIVFIALIIAAHVQK
jgi:hypothetical protein